jgi:hypothetical protein
LLALDRGAGGGAFVAIFFFFLLFGSSPFSCTLSFAALFSPSGLRFSGFLPSIALILSIFESGAISWEFITPDSDTATVVCNSPGTTTFTTTFCCFAIFISDARLEL